MPQLIDSHTHVNFNSYQDDGNDVIRRCLDKNIWLINVGSQYSTSQRALKIAAEYPQGVYAAIGLHPIHLFKTHVDEEEIKFATREEKFDTTKYQALIDSDQYKKIVAVGEIGLDYYHLPDIKTLKHKNIKTIEDIKQIQANELIKQLELASKNNLPVILHCRGLQNDPFGAYDDLYQIIADVIKNKKQPLKGVVHCYGGSLAQAKKFIKLGFYIGFTGIVTFGKNADSIREIVKDLPLDRMLVETDAPYLAPAPHRGQRNEPSYVEFVAQKIAEIKNLTFDEVARQTTKNTEKLFNI